MKYLVFRYADTDMERLYIFPESEKHADFTSRFNPEWKAIRGGMIQLVVDGYDSTTRIHIYGEAFSLGLMPDKEKDLALVKMQLVDVE